jgi:hypothetical protein
MKKWFTILAMALMAVSANAQEEGELGEKLIYEINWEGKWPGVYDGEDTWQGTDEGMSITTSRLMESMWDIRSCVGYEITIEQGHEYIVRLTVKVPSDGTYNVGLGNWWEGKTCSWCVISATASKDFQVIDAEIPAVDFTFDGDALVLFDSGWVLGTTVVKEVQVIEKMKGGTAAIKTAKTVQKSDDAIYNLAGQKVNASYKGLVIKNGKKIIKK